MENVLIMHVGHWTVIKNKTKEFLELLVIFWINGGAVILLSDNDPFTTETNLFLSIISAGFTMKDHILDKKK